MTTFTDELWLRGQAAQRSMLDIATYNTAVFQTVALQALQLTLTAPGGFWAAMVRAGQESPTADVERTTETYPDNVIALVRPSPAEPATVQNPLLLDQPRGGKADDLTELKGIGAKLAEALNDFGIYHFDQIAGLDDDDIAWLSEHQKGFAMICARYDLVAQAKGLRAG